MYFQQNLYRMGQQTYCQQISNAQEARSFALDLHQKQMIDYPAALCIREINQILQFC